MNSNWSHLSEKKWTLATDFGAVISTQMDTINTQMDTVDTQ